MVKEFRRGFKMIDDKQLLIEAMSIVSGVEKLIEVKNYYERNYITTLEELKECKNEIRNLKEKIRGFRRG
jgi:hypothetical protein